MSILSKSALITLLTAVLLAMLPGPSRAAEAGLLLYLPFSADLNDHSGNGHPIKNSKAVRIQNGAAYFDGKKNWLEAPHLPLNQGDFAISMWVKPTGQHPMYGLLEEKDADRGNRWLHVMLRGGRQPYLGFYINDAISPEDIPVNEWTHLVFQYSGNRQEIWVNGQFLCARQAKAYGGAGGILRIGYSPRWKNVPSRDYEGYMRELCIYSRALSQAEILTHYHPADAEKFAQAGFQPPAEPRVTLATRSRETAAVENGVPFLALNGNILTIAGEARQVYDLMVTSDLNKPWEHLLTVTNKLGTLKFTDDSATKRGNTFYRIKLHQPDDPTRQAP